MATSKKVVAKAKTKKAEPAAAKKKQPVAKAAVAKKAAPKAPPAKAVSKSAPKAAPKAAAKSAKPVAKKTVAKKVAAPAKSVKKATKPVAAKASAAKKPVKKAAPAKPIAKAAPSKPVKKAAPAKKVTSPAKPIAKAKATPVAKKAAPAPKPVTPAKPVKTKPVKAVKEAPVKKVTAAEKRAAAKRTASAVQRVQARISASIPKPAPKPAPMPTVMADRDDKKNNIIVAHRRIVGKPKEEVEVSHLTMLEYQPEYKRSILDAEEKETGPTYRYSDEDLAEFKELITARLATARRELAYQQGLITHKDATGTDDTENRYMNVEDGSGAMEREQLAQLASRQIQFINHLEKALIRIENKTYGICRVTGKLIDKARLRAVPHATLSIEAKNIMNANK
ncbi:MAG: TraR/DksA family transcriptional regulator [Bacteroidetes bacterium]|nr:TraR/DksA family transcriptional regulator [Bacteroidota bacterium]MBS1630694.1 TraR/DksA family transcriptional regulator [Bacteroidota bacterium]